MSSLPKPWRRRTTLPCAILALVCSIAGVPALASAQGADGLAPPLASEAPPPASEAPSGAAPPTTSPPASPVAAPDPFDATFDVAPGDAASATDEAITHSSGESADSGAAATPSADAADRLHALVIDAAPYGVDPVVGEHVSLQLRQTAAEMGYAVASRDESVAAAQRARMSYPPSPADLWRVTWTGDAERGVFARVWAQDGRYVIEITVASMDGTGPFFARGSSGAEDLHHVVDGLLRQALPAPGRWDAAAAARYARGAVVNPDLPTPSVVAGSTPATSTFAPVGGQGVRLEPHRRSHRPARRFDLAISTEAAVGTSSDHFYNHLIGARLDFRITTEIMLGVYAGYANLRGRDGRAQNVLLYVSGENRIRLGEGTDLTIPLRFALGYLPFNGPFVRVSAGLNLPVSERVELGIDLIAPTFWVIPSGVAVSANFGIEVIYRL